MQSSYELIGGYGAAKEILTQPLGAIGFVHYDGQVRTVFLRAHDRVGHTSTGETVVSASAYLADPDSYGSIEDMVSDSDVSRGRDHGNILAWQVTAHGIDPLYRYDEALTRGEGDDLDGNDEALTEAIASLPPGCGFLVGDYTSSHSSFTLGLREGDGAFSSDCGPAITTEEFSDTPDMTDVPDDPAAGVQTVQVLVVAQPVPEGQA